MEHVLSSIELLLEFIYWLRSRVDPGYQAFPRDLTVRSQSGQQSGHSQVTCFAGVSRILIKIIRFSFY